MSQTLKVSSSLGSGALTSTRSPQALKRYLSLPLRRQELTSAREAPSRFQPSGSSHHSNRRADFSSVTCHRCTSQLPIFPIARSLCRSPTGHSTHSSRLPERRAHQHSLLQETPGSRFLRRTSSIEPSVQARGSSSDKIYRFHKTSSRALIERCRVSARCSIPPFSGSHSITPETLCLNSPPSPLRLLEKENGREQTVASPCPSSLAEQPL